MQEQADEEQKIASTARVVTMTANSNRRALSAGSGGGGHQELMVPVCSWQNRGLGALMWPVLSIPGI